MSKLYNPFNATTAEIQSMDRATLATWYAAICAKRRKCLWCARFIPAGDFSCSHCGVSRLGPSDSPLYRAYNNRAWDLDEAAFLAEDRSILLGSDGPACNPTPAPITCAHCGSHGQYGTICPTTQACCFLDRTHFAQLIRAKLFRDDAQACGEQVCPHCLAFPCVCNDARWYDALSPKGTGADPVDPSPSEELRELIQGLPDPPAAAPPVPQRPHSIRIQPTAGGYSEIRFSDRTEAAAAFETLEKLPTDCTFTLHLAREEFIPDEVRNYRDDNPAWATCNPDY